MRVGQFEKGQFYDGIEVDPRSAPGSKPVNASGKDSILDPYEERLASS